MEYRTILFPKDTPSRIQYVGIGLLLFSISYSNGQEVIGVHPSGRGREKLPLFSEEKLVAPPPGKVLPVLPKPSDQMLQNLPTLEVFVNEIRVRGNTVFSDAELAKFASSYVNRTISSEDLEQLRLDLTKYYIDRGYVNSGAFIPDQTVENGIIEYWIIEGELTDIEVKGNRWFRPGYIRNRFFLDAGPPVNIHTLQNRLQLLQQHPGIERLNAELRPGVEPGESVLNVDVTENSPYRVELEFNNYQSPTVGAERGTVTLSHENVFGFGDRLWLSDGFSEGVDDQIDLGYSLPVNRHDTILSLRYGKNDFSVVEDPFEAIDVESETESYTLGIEHPFYQTLRDTITLTLEGEWIFNQTFVLGNGVPLSAGADEGDGESRVAALRFSQQWVSRRQNQVVAVNSSINLGLDVFGATNNSNKVADSQFLYWLGQFQWVHRIPASGAQVIFRADLQLSNDSLLPVEQIAVGGRNSVRGYRENQLVRDNAFVTSLETRIPLVRNKRWVDTLEVIPFFDWGRGWNKNTSSPEPKNIASMGIGLSWSATLPLRYPIRPEFEIFWGHGMKDVATEGGDLQDDGIHLRFRIGNF